ncbi:MULTISPECIES: hypothetical protein [Pseudomonas]|uniref:hypothetical protein n=1 Tax=Pseudomonas TaxID=286 RepID=UPI00070B0692|nr:MULTISPECIES: hypothetical protein [Pseudomonas]KQW19996.1 hypothetical protein ASC85_09175 [Pseudomonas sp. Root401]WHS57594.1 hypothetical protein QLH64_30035 [Pseudomonas brassicacearum]
MTETLINFAIIAAALFGVSYTPWIKRCLGGHPAKTQILLFKVLVGALYLLSLHETIDEDGFLYGLTFSLIPLAAGAVVLGSMRPRHKAISKPAPISGIGGVGVHADDTAPTQ